MSRILVIDDQAPVRKVIVRMLTTAGHLVSAAPDGPAGHDLWRETGADLVLTDVQMPQMSGVEGIRELRADAPALPVIVMSGNERDSAMVRDAEQLGPVGILRKPFSWEELM